MRLSEQGLQEERDQWEAAGYRLPWYDHRAMVQATRREPFWIHFGAGFGLSRRMWSRICWIKRSWTGA